MKGTLFLGNRSFVTRDLPDREPGPSDVRIRNRSCGICGTDVHIYLGEQGSAAVKPPVVLGHELSGEVEQVGSAVSTVRAGDKVSVDPNIYCGRCRFCKSGKKQHCENLVAVGVNFDGGFAEYCVVPEKQCFLLADDVSFETGAMAEPAACCLHGIELARIRLGSTVCVVGGGPIGQIMVQLARLSGAAAVLLSEPVAARRAIGLQLGADAAIDPGCESLPDAIRQITGLDGADVVIECVGKAAATRQAIAAARPGATVLLFSVPSPQSVYELPLFDVFRKELRIQGSFINPDTHQAAVDLINSGRLRTDLLVTHRFPLERVEEAILAQMGDASLKVMVLP